MISSPYSSAIWALFPKLVAAVLFSAVLPMASAAATIERHVDPVMGCAVKVSGLIVDGDAGRLREVLETVDPWTDNGMPERWSTGNHGYRVCFDSPGGSLPEGIRMARAIQELLFGTAIAAGARCESACAIAFMAGIQMSENDYEGDRSLVDRVLHPRGRLGFHAPELLVETGQYNEIQVRRAYAVALDSVSALLDLIEETRIEFPQSLLREMLATPPDSMFRILRVEQALGWGILVAPTRFSALPVLVTFETLCGSYGGYPRDSDHFESLVAVRFADRRADPSDPSLSVQLNMDGGFGMEAAGACAVDFSIPADIARYIPEQMRGRLVSEFEGSTPAFASYPGSMPLASLPEPDYSADLAFTQRFRNRLERQQVELNSCWLTSPTARITNVNEYVNLRRQPDFSAPVIRQVPLGEGVRAQRADNITVIGQERDRQSCINACQAFGRNADDRAARDRAQQCIHDNMIWYEITDARGNRGWVSRRYLEEAR